MKRWLNQLPWPFKIALYLGTLVVLAGRMAATPLPIFIVVMLGFCLLFHAIFDPHPSLVQEDQREKTP